MDRYRAAGWTAGLILAGIFAAAISVSTRFLRLFPRQPWDYETKDRKEAENKDFSVTYSF